MKSLSESTIKTLAGEAAFDKGKHYYNDGRVTNLSINGSRISAEVAGNEVYTVTLNHTNKIFDGSCTCPASDNFDFCKHCAATSLAYYYQTQTNLEIADAADENTVLLYLSTLTKPQLVEELHKLVAGDDTLHDHWLLRAELASGKLSAKDLRTRITKAIPYKPSGLWRHQDVARYFSEVGMALDALEHAVLSLPSQDSIKLAIYAIERLEKSLRTIDDSSGYRLPIEEKLKSWFQLIFSADDWQTPQRVNLVGELILSEKSEYDLLSLPFGVSDLLEQAALKTIIEKVATAWNTLTPPSKDERYDNVHYSRLERLLLEDARQHNNIDRELEILGKGAVDTDRCLKLVRRCIKVQRLEEAAKWLDYASQVQTLRPYDVAAIETHQIDLWLAQGDFENALNAQWTRFEESEDHNDLKVVLKTAHKLDKRNDYLKQAVRYLDSKIEPKQDSPRNRQRVENLVTVYLNNNMVGSAIKLASQHKLHPSILMAVVNAAPKHTNATAILIDRAVNSLISQGNNETYDRANWFLYKLYNKVNEQDKELIEYAIKKIYARPENKRKSNFVKPLKQHFDFI